MAFSDIFEHYLKRLTEEAQQGDAREESFYPALKELLEQFARTRRYAHVHVTIQPRPIEAGNPDFRVWDGNQHIVGYLEAKMPTADLHRQEETEQIQRYLSTFPNFILTSFLEFRLYRDGQRVATALHEFTHKYGAGGQRELIRSHILRYFFAFELMMAPYAVGHLKMAFFLEEMGYHLADGERIPFYLTNTLDMSELEASRLPGLSSLAEESHLAAEVKREQPAAVSSPPLPALSPCKRR